MNTEFVKAFGYLDGEKYDKAEDCLKKAIQIAKEEKRDYDLMEIYCCYGEFLAMVDRIDEAKKYLNEIDAYHDKTYECQTLYDMAVELLNELDEELW